MIEHDDVPLIVEERSPLLGQRLRQAREAKKLTVTEAATQLRISSSAIQALEHEKWDQLHGRTYARGYFINYVKFLGLPMDEMMSLFNQKYIETQPPVGLSRNRMVPEEKPFPWFIWLVMLVIIAIAVFAFTQWQSQQATSEVAFVEQQPSVNAQTTGSDFLGQLDAGETVPEQLLNNTLEGQSVDQTATPVANEMPLDVVQEQIQTIPEQDAHVEETVASDEAAVGRASLVLRVTEQCWIEVIDAGGSALFRRIAQDEVIRLEGSKPLSVRLGNAAAVELTFNDELIDVANYAQGNVARLTLGAES